MGRIRSALRAYALETTDPADVLSRRDRKVQLFEPDAMATVAYAVLDPEGDTMRVSSAGHLPALIAERGKPARTLSVPPDLPVGAYRDAPRQSTRVELGAGACLFLYTDGLVERPDRSIIDGIDLLVSTVFCARADTMCATAMAAMLGDRAATDDVAVLAVRRT
jgi:serine phosphatase RsbU (regulator of sigma subunit)